MGVCANCITRKQNLQKYQHQSSTFEIQAVDFPHFENESLVMIPQTLKKEEEKKKVMPLLNILNSNTKQENIKNNEKIINKQKKKNFVNLKKKSKKVLKKNFLQKKAKKKKLRWNEEDEEIYQGISAKYDGDLNILKKHFKNKKTLLNLKISSLNLQKCKTEIKIQTLKEDYIKYGANWDFLSNKYKVSLNSLKTYFYGYIYQSFLNANRPNSETNKSNAPNIEIKIITRNNTIFSKEKESPLLSSSRKGDLSDFNEDNNFLEEKISYLSARKEILESLQNFLTESDDTAEID